MWGAASASGTMLGGRWPRYFLVAGAGNKMHDVLQPFYVRMYVLEYRYFLITELGSFVTDILYGSIATKGPHDFCGCLDQRSTVTGFFDYF